MKNLTINTPFDKPELTSKKSRLISIINNKVLVCNYSGFYMLPGGKVDENETFEDAVIREIHEETGNKLTSNDIDAYLSVDNYQENYLSRSIPLNQLIKKPLLFTIKQLKKLPMKMPFYLPLRKWKYAYRIHGY